MFANCSNCGNSAVKKVSGIVRSEIKTSRTDTHSVKVGRYRYGVGVSGGHGSTVRSSVSALAQTLMEPSMPPMPEPPPAPKRRTAKSLPPTSSPLHSPPPTFQEVGKKETRYAQGLTCAGVLSLPIVGLISLFNSQMANVILLILFGGAAYQYYRANLAKQTKEAEQARQNHAIAKANWEQNRVAVEAERSQERAIEVAKWEQNRAIAQANLDAKYAAEMAQWERDKEQWRHECNAIQCWWERALKNWVVAL